MSTNVNTAVIGLGMFGALQAQVYAESPLAKLQAVVSRSSERAREIGERFGARWYTDYRDMLEREGDVQAVSIATRDAEHKESTIACAQAGKDIFLEKPMAPSLEEADAMIAAVEKAGVRMMVDFTLHFDPTYLAAYERIQAGEIGDVLTMFARRNGTQSAGYPGQPVPYSEWTDILISTGIHELELMTWYADAPVRAGLWRVSKPGGPRRSRGRWLHGAGTVRERRCWQPGIHGLAAGHRTSPDQLSLRHRRQSWLYLYRAHQQYPLHLQRGAVLPSRYHAVAGTERTGKGHTARVDAPFLDLSLGGQGAQCRCGGGPPGSAVGPGHSGIVPEGNAG